MVNVALDARGNLVGFRAAPPQVERLRRRRPRHHPTGNRSSRPRAWIRRGSRRLRPDGFRASRSTRAPVGTALTHRVPRFRYTSRRLRGAASRSPSRSSVPGADRRGCRRRRRPVAVRGPPGRDRLRDPFDHDRGRARGAAQPAPGPRRPPRRLPGRRVFVRRADPPVDLRGAPRRGHGRRVRPVRGGTCRGFARRGLHLVHLRRDRADRPPPVAGSAHLVEPTPGRAVPRSAGRPRRARGTARRGADQSLLLDRPTPSRTGST